MMIEDNNEDSLRENFRKGIQDSEFEELKNHLIRCAEMEEDDTKRVLLESISLQLYLLGKKRGRELYATR